MDLAFANLGLVEECAALPPPGQVALFDEYRQDFSDRAVGQVSAASLEDFQDVVGTDLPRRPDDLHELEFHLSEGC